MGLTPRLSDHSPASVCSAQPRPVSPAVMRTPQVPHAGPPGGRPQARSQKFPSPTGDVMESMRIFASSLGDDGAVMDSLTYYAALQILGKPKSRLVTLLDAVATAGLTAWAAGALATGRDAGPPLSVLEVKNEVVRYGHEIVRRVRSGAADSLVLIVLSVSPQR